MKITNKLIIMIIIISDQIQKTMIINNDTLIGNNMDNSNINVIILIILINDTNI